MSVTSDQPLDMSVEGVEWTEGGEGQARQSQAQEPTLIEPSTTEDPLKTTSSTTSGTLREAELRKAMLEIQQDSTLMPTEKARRMQELMTSSYVPKRPPSRSSELSRSNSTSKSPLSPSEDADLAELFLSDEDRTPQYYTKEGTKGDQSSPILGCSHYQTGCKILADCCKGWYCCRFCHDEASDHAIDRYATRFILCMHCGTAQRASKACQRCKQIMGHYYCDKCKLWDNDERKEIFHCEDCNMCRRGRREEFQHCKTCGGCISVDFFHQHKCLDRSLQSNCPICGDHLFTTVIPVMFMPCGHSIHYLCHQAHIRNSYQCPICLKSLSNMSHLFQRIDELMATQQMPEEYAKMRSQILCNDCERKSITNFHFIYHRCMHCRSYNTKLLRTFNEIDTLPQLTVDSDVSSSSSSASASITHPSNISPTEHHHHNQSQTQSQPYPATTNTLVPPLSDTPEPENYLQ